jgi:hypothetical protein
MKQQMALQVSQIEDVARLNRYLEDGWVVVQMCPMPSATTLRGETVSTKVFSPTCLVIIQNNEE